MAFPARLSLLILCSSLGGCVAPIVIGGTPDDTDSSGNSMGDVGSQTLDGGSSGGPAVTCPDSPPDFACTVPYECGELCGGLQSEFDVDGCLRARCTTDADCRRSRLRASG